MVNVIWAINLNSCIKKCQESWNKNVGLIVLFQYEWAKKLIKNHGNNSSENLIARYCTIMKMQLQLAYKECLVVSLRCAKNFPERKSKNRVKNQTYRRESKKNNRKFLLNEW